MGGRLFCEKTRKSEKIRVFKIRKDLVNRISHVILSNFTKFHVNIIDQSKVIAKYWYRMIYIFQVIDGRPISFNRLQI